MIFILQVETVAQFGVVFLLFALGLEFSLTKVFYFVKLVQENIIMKYVYSFYITSFPFYKNRSNFWCS